MTEQEAKGEIDKLKGAAKKLNWYLLAVSLAFLVVSILLAIYGPGMTDVPWWGIALSISAGVLGSAVAALQSAQERRANGWQISNGDKYPKEEPHDKFNEGMVPRFYTRPFLGAVTGAVFYFGAPTVFGLGPAVQTDPGRLVFWSFVVGILAKTFIETLKDLFKKLGK